MPSRDKLTSLTAPTLIRHAEVPYVVWGDDESHFVNDLFYVLSSQLVFVTVTLPPGGMFRSSDKFRAYFDTHECLYVLAGEYTCQDPETGEVKTARQGEMLFMPQKRWHYGYNFGTTELRLLECIAPPTNQAALAHVPRPSRIVPFNPASFTDLPRKPGSVECNLTVCRPTTAVSAVIGNRNPVLFQVLASTERVCFAKAMLRPNSHSELLCLPFDVCYHGLQDLVHIQSPASGEYFAVGPSDVAFIPAGTAHRLFNHSPNTLPILLGGAGSFAKISAQ
jgi:mannose-6-phosphate isomerase-like protein (cupin superfamily)